jgi:glycosyltransferase involved in cell wall biosynthesis
MLLCTEPSDEARVFQGDLSMSSSPLVSIVTPSYNHAIYLEEALQSVRAQTYPHVEHIVIDGASTDQTLEVLRRYTDRLRWVSEPDAGQASAINKGFRMARGEIWGWLNADDTLAADAVQIAVQAFLQEPDVMMVYGEGFVIDETGKRVGRFEYTEPFDLSRLIDVLDYILQPTVFFRREIFQEISMLDESLHWCFDWDLWIRIGQRFKVRYLPQYLASSRVYEQTKTSRGGDKRFREIAMVVRKYSGRRFPPAYFIYGVDTKYRKYKALLDKIDVLLQRLSARTDGRTPLKEAWYGFAHRLIMTGRLPWERR